MGYDMGKFLALVLAIGGALLGSQAPGFTLQYMQNLAGRVAELRPIVEDFDAGIARYGYTREQALAECAQAAGLLDALCEGYETTIRRYMMLSEHLDALEAASDLERPVVLAASYMPDIADSTLDQFKPAVPTTVDGAAYAGGGLAGIWGVFSAIWALITMPFRGRGDGQRRVQEPPASRWA